MRLNKDFTISDKHVNSLRIENKEDVHTYLMNISTVSSDLTESLESLLSLDELDKINRFIFEKDRISHTISQGMLRYILSGYLSISPEEIAFSTNEYGKPFISEEQNPENIQFNLSHSGDMIMYAISKGRNVGIDIQEIKDSGSVTDIVDHYFSEKEKEEYRSLTDDQKLKGFYSCWSRKEAYIKALGLGLSYPLNSFSVKVIPDFSSELIYDNKGGAWTLTDIAASPGYAAAVAVEGSDVSYRHYRLTAGGDESVQPYQEELYSRASL